MTASTLLHMDPPDRSHLLMMGFLDAELDEAGRKEFLARCEADPALAKEFAHYQKLAHLARAVRTREPTDAHRQRIDRSVWFRFTRGIGALTTLVSALGLVITGVMRALHAEILPLWPHSGFAFLGGVTLYSGAELFAHRQMLKFDRYQGIHR